MQVKSGFACEEDVKTIKTQITGRVQQLKREREVRRLSLTSVPDSHHPSVTTRRLSVASVVDSHQPAVTTAASHMPFITSNPAVSVNSQCSQEKDGHVEGKRILLTTLVVQVKRKVISFKISNEIIFRLDIWLAGS